MTKKIILNRKKVNPSVAIFTGVKHSEKIHAQLFQYNQNDYIEEPNFVESNFSGFQEKDYLYWLNIHGIHDVQIIESISKKMSIHQLTIQDILDINQRPKIQEYDNYCFFSLKSILPSKDQEFAIEQLSFILGENYLISFQEKKQIILIMFGNESGKILV